MKTSKQVTDNNRDEAYRGYLIRTNPLTGDVTISKGGFHIAYAASKDEARTAIDQLVS